MMTNSILLIQTLVAVGWIMIIVYCLKVWQRVHDRRFLLIPVILWAFYGILFYMSVWTGLIDSGSHEAIMLSAVGRMVDVTLVLSGLYVLFGTPHEPRHQ